MERCILRITDIKEDVNLSHKQNIQVAFHKSGKPHIDRKGVAEFLNGLSYPLQYSLYIVKDKDDKPERHSYLAPGDKDPRAEINMLHKLVIFS